jgi:hypothetical protein
MIVLIHSLFTAQLTLVRVLWGFHLGLLVLRYSLGLSWYPQQVIGFAMAVPIHTHNRRRALNGDGTYIWGEKMIIIYKLVIAPLFILALLFALGWTNWKTSTNKNQQFNGMQLIVKDLPQHGVVIHDSSNPAFKNELSAFYLIPPDLLNDALRYSIIVQNDTMQHIIALTVIWRFYPSQGAPIERTYSHSFSNQMFNNPAESLIKPNGKYGMCLLLPSAGFSSQKTQEIKKNNQLTNQLNQLNSLIARSAKWSVDIDGVLFSNGIYVGADSAKYFDFYNTKYKGARDLIEELMQKLNDNKPHADVFAHAQAYASITDAELEAPFSDFRQRMNNPVYVYNSVKTQMARQIIKRRTNFGEQATIDFIRQSSRFHISLVKH